MKELLVEDCRKGEVLTFLAMLLDRENVTQGSILRTERARLGDER